ncbi:MAG TPA: molybdopterin oxidoreductase family protein [Chthonomonadaceae bacterium]|nr:molybdopterin oxidoreductase family protein [Chthonomonadaceae bacterium]
MLEIIKTACPHDCPDTCSMLATVQDGRLLGVAGNPENPYTRDNLCRKVAHYEERVYSPDRVLTPMRRVGKKGEGKFERISWDEAIAEIAGRWKAIIAESGPEAILPFSYAGTMGVVNMSACDSRLWLRMGASQLLRTICSSAAEAGYGYVNGWTGGIDPEDFVNSKFIIAWGTNLSSTNVHMMPIIREAQARGATFVVIDPYKTRTANAADWFVQPKPGTDAALALGMAHVIFADGLHDEAFLEAHSIGWRQFRDRCAEYPPERVAAITGLDAEEIVRLARGYATQRPSAIRLGYGLSRNGNGGSMIRAIVCLPAVIGAWGKPGSGLLLSTSAHFPLNMRSVKRPDLLHSPDDESPIKWGRRVPRAINMNEIGRALLETTDPPIRALYVYNSNPAAVAPNSNLVREGLCRTDLFTVVHEQMLTDTARYADIVLPATTQMEHLDLLRAYGHLYLNLCQPAIPPLGEARPNLDVMNALAKAMGYTDSVFDETAEDVIRGALDIDHPFMEGITYEYLREHGFAKLKTPTSPYVPYAEGTGFKTVSGKIEIYSEQAAKDGYDPLPNYAPPAESAEADPELAAEFPINLLSPAAHHFLNSSFANLTSLQKGEKEPRIWIHPQDAAERGVRDGDWLRVWNRRGQVRLKAVLSDKVKPGVAWSPSLWWHRDSPEGGNVNALTSDRLTDMGGGSTFHTNLVQFARAEG